MRWLTCILKLDVFKARLAKEKNLREVCDNVGIARNTLKRIMETGRASKPITEKMSKYLNVPLEEIVEREEGITPCRHGNIGRLVRIKRGKLIWAMLNVAENVTAFSRQVDVHQAVISDVLNRKRCAYRTLERICAGLSQPPEEFIEEEI